MSTPALKAFCHARVIEIPTARRADHDPACFEVSNFAPEVPTMLTERALTSPIWYAPS